MLSMIKKNDNQSSERRSKEEVVMGEEDSRGRDEDTIEASGSGGHNASLSVAPRYKIRPKQEQYEFPLIQEQLREPVAGVSSFAEIKLENREINLQVGDQQPSFARI
jgi:hypothetical protein